MSYLASQGIRNIDDNQLPVCLPIIDHGERAQNLHLQHVASLGNPEQVETNYYGSPTALLDNIFKIIFLTVRAPVSDLAAVHGIVVSLAARALVLVVRVLPGLGQRAVVPDVAVVREAVGHVAQLALLLVLRRQLLTLHLNTRTFAKF